VKDLASKVSKEIEADTSLAECKLKASSIFPILLLSLLGIA
jgi:hypothetical protein